MVQKYTDIIEAGKSEETLVAFFEKFPDGFFLFSAGGNILCCNTTLADMTGYNKEEIVSMRIEDLFRDDLIRRILFHGDTGSDGERDFRIEVVCSGRNDLVFPAELTVKLLKTGDGSAGFVFVRDISTEREKSEKINNMKYQLRHVQKMETLGNLTGGISHYFNNVFTGILGNLSLAEINAPAKIPHLIKHAVKSADRARSFTRQVLSLSRKSTIVPEPVDIAVIIDDAEIFAKLAFDRYIEILVKKPEDLPDVLADAASIHHILLNLCVNARDAIEEKRCVSPGTTKSRITIEAVPITVDERYAREHTGASPGDYMKISVTDTGCGMNADIKDRILEPFFTTKEPGKGTGLGLSTAVETINQHGGWLDIETEPGRGSTFSLFLPTVTLKKKKTGELKTEDLPKGQGTILFVDDEEMVRSFSVMTLEQLGYSLLEASDGQEALDTFIKNQDTIDLVVLDLGLPVLSGREFLKKIRLIDNDVQVIISTGHEFERDRKIFEELRALDYILKPFTIYDLALSVHNVLNRNVNHT